MYTFICLYCIFITLAYVMLFLILLYAHIYNGYCFFKINKKNNKISLDRISENVYQN